MKTAKPHVVCLIAILILLSFPQEGFAQLADFYTSPGYSTYINGLITNSIWKSSMERYTKTYQGRSTTSRRPSGSSSPASPPLVPAYRRYPAVQFKSSGTRLTLQEYLDAVNISTADKTELKQLVLKIFKDYEAEAAAKGYPNDWALAFVSYVGLNSHVYHGRREKPIIPFEQNVGLRDVVAEYATDNGIFNNVSDRQKQELYELLIIMSGLTYHFYEKALRENNVEELNSIKQTAAENLRRVGTRP